MRHLIITDSVYQVVATIDSKNFSCTVDNVEINDVTGAGDCFIAAFTYALVQGYDYQKCLEIAVKGSTESVKHTGTYVLKKEDLEEKVIFTNGCFDVLHLGHLKLLEESKKLGDKLVVGLNSDASVKRLKGSNRPINNQETRKLQLEALPWVDEVVIFEDDTPYELIERVKPDLIVKGGDYSVETVVGHNLAPVYIFPLLDGYSTTKIIEAYK
jgi:D-beta-D-heptose 7-phosphate kinase/D-beta-D-heptose 1-phosphate adenosyltransferase